MNLGHRLSSCCQQWSTLLLVESLLGALPPVLGMLCLPRAQAEGILVLGELRRLAAGVSVPVTPHLPRQGAAGECPSLGVWLMGWGWHGGEER